ncbi:MAG: hypothetical protein KJ042_12270 [Deltaproteobacteria bacterium]|nr:hypothetical protein [Deltaproteobacteria bacterium]
MLPRTAAIVAALIFVLAAGTAHAVETGESAMGFQAGGAVLGGKLGELFSPDFAYGVNMAFGITDSVGIFADALYAVHQQADKDKYGTLNFAHGTLAIGPRGGYTWDHFALYAGAAPLASLMTYKARYPAGSGTGEDETDSHGFGGMAEIGADAFVSSSLTVGLAGRVNVVATDLEFASGADADNLVETYTWYAGLLRVTLIF